MLRALWSALLDIVYPPKCPVCRRPVAAHGAWCDVCLAGILAVRYLNPAGHHFKALDECLVICEYTGGVKRLLHDMKYRQAERYAVHLQWLLAEGRAEGILESCDLIIPVPLSAGRLQERGYNQTERIFKDWCEKNAAGKWRGDVLVRRRETLPQWELDLARRRKNIKGAFAVTRPEVIRGKHIVLADDIVTSGLTMEACAQALKKSGAAKITGLALSGGGQ
ncbi:hypothetical protein P22_0509 [Propionispora sp. 2/2-37]|uniref:ComF family protein n=1 Tax=Propionispora sp. 2/2-37 TaxID=1677858 RepID=UPI0006BB72C1|nr:double zinc ribbon domain-containing protein [Propionispora sp. 2/2-37]CUH94443.1 hypothetical protein P22_0509 [Propionispora sp. 2/2-37]